MFTLQNIFDLICINQKKEMIQRVKGATFLLSKNIH